MSNKHDCWSVIIESLSWLKINGSWTKICQKNYFSWIENFTIFFLQSLITLAIINVLFLSIIITDHCIDVYSTTYILLFPHLLNPLKNIAVNSESFLIMAIALERLLVVVKPIRYRVGILRQSPRIHSLVFIIPPIVISFLMNIPKFMETELFYFNVTNIHDGKKSHLWDYRLTSLRKDPDYIYYYVHWFRNIFTGIIPIIFLIIVNITICYFLTSNTKSQYQYSMSSMRWQDGASEQSLMERRSTRIHIPLEILNIPELSQPRQPSQRIYKRKSNYSVLTLTSIAIMYILCNIPRLILNLAEHFLHEELSSKKDSCGCKIEPKWFTNLCSLSHFLLTLNSSANFIIYGVTEKKFKITGKRLIHNFGTGVIFLKEFLTKIFCPCLSWFGPDNLSKQCNL